MERKPVEQLCGSSVGAGVTGAGVTGAGETGAGVDGAGVDGAGVIGAGVLGAGEPPRILIWAFGRIAASCNRRFESLIGSFLNNA